MKRSALVRKAADRAELTVKPKTCKSCAREFFPARPLQVACTVRCARAMVDQDKAAKRAADKARAERLKPRSYWLKRAQDRFNAWVRMRDAHQPCISCGTRSAEVWHAGHFYSTAARPDLRFDPANVHRQCAQCNLFLSGNLIAYAANLPARIGQAEVDRLSGPPTAERATVTVLQALHDDYRAKLKAMKSPQPSNDSGSRRAKCASC